MASDNVPNFENLDETKLAAIKASLGIIAAEAGISSDGQPSTSSNPIAPANPTVFTNRVPRKRGRPRTRPVEEFEPVNEQPERIENPIPPVQTFSRRDEREVAERLANLFTSATGMASMAKPYLAMTDEEASNIAKPLASYLIRNEPTQVIAREILDNYDLLAIIVGVMAYTVRVYRDRSTEVAESKSKSAPRSVAERISEYQTGNLERPENGQSSQQLPIPYSIPGNGPGL